MLRVTIEELPGGDTTRARVLAVMGVANVSNLAEISSYVYVVRYAKGPERCGVVRDHHRSAGFWPLLARAARAAAAASSPPVARKWRETVAQITDCL